MEKILKRQYDFIYNLEPHLYSSLKKYTSDFFLKLNYSLRNDLAQLDNECKELIRDIDYVFSKIPPIKESITLYRGSSIHDDDNFKKIIKSYISTTDSINIANTFTDIFSDCCLYKIYVPSGTKIIPLKSLSHFDYENEYLLPRDGKLITTNVYNINIHKNEKICYDGVYISKNISILNTLHNKKDITNEIIYNQINDNILRELDLDDSNDNLYDKILNILEIKYPNYVKDEKFIEQLFEKIDDLKE